MIDLAQALTPSSSSTTPQAPPAGAEDPCDDDMPPGIGLPPPVLPPRLATPAVPFLPWLPPEAPIRRMPLRIVIDGSIGSGKTTVMEYLSEHLPSSDWTVMHEPLHRWQLLLEEFYRTYSQQHAQAKYAIAALLQVAVINAYALDTPDYVAAPRLVMERSPWSCLAVFLKAQGLPHEFEQVVLDAAYSMQQSLEKALPRAIVYLRASPETCFSRLGTCQRPGEELVPLSYLQLLGSIYDGAAKNFGGPHVIVYANRQPDVVAAEVLQAVLSLAEVEPQPYDLYLPRRTPTAHNPLTSPGGTVTVPCRPDVYRQYPGQILLMQHAPDDVPQSLTCSESSLTASSKVPPTKTQQQHAQTTVSPSNFNWCDYPYAPTPVRFLFVPEIEATCLFQSGPGHFKFSPLFEQRYLETYSEPVNPNDRIDNLKALEIYAALAPWDSRAPGANIQLAVAPRKVLHALRVRRTHDNCADTVYVDAPAYAEQRFKHLLATSPSLAQEGSMESTFPWLESLRHEAYTLDGWIHVVRMRPLLICESRHLCLRAAQCHLWLRSMRMLSPFPSP